MYDPHTSHTPPCGQSFALSLTRPGPARLLRRDHARVGRGLRALFLQVPLLSALRSARRLMRLAKGAVSRRGRAAALCLALQCRSCSCTNSLASGLALTM